jgi:hypothetical protein
MTTTDIHADRRPAQCTCSQRCPHQLTWASRALMAQCCADDAECTCWCHEQGRTEREDATRRSIYWVKR